MKKFLFLCAVIKIPVKSLVMLNNYETVLITTPVLSESQMKETVEKFKNILAGSKAEIVYEENWGLRKLAYPIQKKSTGFYYMIEFKAGGEVIDKLETEYRRDERIIRFLTLKLDKYGVEYAEKKRRKKKEKEEEGSEKVKEDNHE